MKKKVIPAIIRVEFYSRTRKRGGAEHAEVSRGHSRDMDMETWTC